jgi:type IV secretory pathway VirB6-like protein
MFHHFFKSFLYILFIWDFPNQLISQKVNISLIIPPPYPTTVEGILKFNHQAIATVINTTNSTQNIKLLISLKGNNGVTTVMLTDYVGSAEKHKNYL